MSNCHTSDEVAPNPVVSNTFASVNFKQDQPSIKIGIGIDFGTSNSAAATFDGKQVNMVALEDHSAIMPSASYIDKGFVTTTGQDSINQYIGSNQGRKVELSAEVIGEARSTTGQMDADTKLPSTAPTNLLYGHSFNDGSLPGRLFRGTKRLLGSASEQRIMVFKRPFRLVALITPILLRIAKKIETSVKAQAEFENETIDHACIGHPVNFEGYQHDHNTLALKCLSESYQHAGISKQLFYPEPIAATISYLYANPERETIEGDRLLTIDFGGGTLDFCILLYSNSSFEVEAIHGIALGGDKIDQAVFKKLLFPLLGKGERWSRTVDGCLVDTLFPFDDYEDLLINWPVSYMLNQNEYTTPVLEKILDNDSSTIKFKRLYELISQNYCYQVFQAIKELKAKLSIEEVATLDIPELDIEVQVQRSEFEKIIADLLVDFEEAIHFTLNKAGLEKKDIKLVLRTGGSSLIPAVMNVLEKTFPAKVVEHDPFTSVAAGLAIADYYNYGKNLKK